MTKGADNIMESRIKWHNSMKQDVQTHLYGFAIEGL